MRKAKIYRYCLPMDSGVILRDNKLTERIGYIVELSDGENTGLGEVAPLFGFSLESTEEAGIQLQEQAERWVAGIPVDYANMYPSVAFGLIHGPIGVRRWFADARQISNCSTVYGRSR